MGNRSFGKGFEEGKKAQKKNNQITNFVTFLVGISIGALSILFSKNNSKE